MKMSLILLAAAAALILLVLGACASGAGKSGEIADRFPPEGAFVTVEGVRLHHKITGPQGAPEVLVLHGASSNLEEPMLALAEDLSQYRVVWLDRPGLGWSERPEGGGDWTPAREAELITAFLTEIDMSEATLVGHSWGAAITLRLMMDHPGRTHGAVLIAPAVRANVGDAAFYNELTTWPVIGTIVTRAVVPLVGPGSLEDGVESAFKPEPVPENYIEDAEIPLILRPGPWRHNAADMARVNESLEAQEDRYGEISQPVILLAGPEDTVVYTDRHARPVSETLPNGELRLIEGAGHNLHHWHGAAVAEAVEDVIARAR
ncbi:MAG: alpha/beta hydrolase [Oceanicaulis sp.]